MTHHYSCLLSFYFKNKAWERNWQVFPLTFQQDGVEAPVLLDGFEFLNFGSRMFLGCLLGEHTGAFPRAM